MVDFEEFDRTFGLSPRRDQPRGLRIERATLMEDVERASEPDYHAELDRAMPLRATRVARRLPLFLVFDAGDELDEVIRRERAEKERLEREAAEAAAAAESEGGDAA